MADETQWVMGFHAVQAALKKGRLTSEIWVDSQRRDKRIKDLIAQARETDVKILQVSGNDLDKVAKGARHQGVLARVLAPQAHDETFLKALLRRLNVAPYLLVLDGVQDPHNLGACLRTAEATGVQAVIIPRDRSAGLNATVCKVASGAAEVVPLIQATNLARTLQWLKKEGVWLIGTAGEAEQSIYQTDLLGPLAIVMGGEGKGLRRLTREQCDLLVFLPMLGSVESLNVSVATGVALYEAVRQRSA
ncbi:MAG: 23S rRNA (guanosine(2251)-2'-O)-methyltransferase RlmB [Pseudomonadota bacterium]